MSKLASLLFLSIILSVCCQAEIAAKGRSNQDGLKDEQAGSQSFSQPASPFAVGNFFSASAAAAVKPSVEKRPGPKDPIGMQLVDLNPTLEQVRLIPSLDGPQRKQVGDLYNVYRSDLKLLNDQLRPLREEFRSRLKSEKEKQDKEKLEKDKLEKEKLERERLQKEKLEKEKLEREKLEKAKLEMAKTVPPKEEDDPAVREAVAKIKARQTEFTQALNKIVTPAQMLELEQLRRGKVPAYAQ